MLLCDIAESLLTQVHVCLTLIRQFVLFFVYLLVDSSNLTKKHSTYLTNTMLFSRKHVLTPTKRIQ